MGIPGVVVLDFRPVMEGFRKVGAMLAGIQRMMRPGSGAALAYRRNLEGGNGTDAYVHPDQWLSTHCAGLLCWTGEPCPHAGLGCTCRCHHR